MRELGNSTGEAPMKAHGQRRGWSMTEVAELYGLSESYVRRQVASGALKPVRLGRRVLITDRAIEEWLRDATAKTGPKCY